MSQAPELWSWIPRWIVSPLVLSVFTEPSLEAELVVSHLFVCVCFLISMLNYSLMMEEKSPRPGKEQKRHPEVHQADMGSPGWAAPGSGEESRSLPTPCWVRTGHQGLFRPQPNCQVVRDGELWAGGKWFWNRDLRYSRCQCCWYDNLKTFMKWAHLTSPTDT